VKKIKNIIIENNFSNDVFLRTIMDKCLENWFSPEWTDIKICKVMMEKKDI
jgi:hypothetical protein